MCLITVCPKGTVKYNSDIESFVRNGMFTNTHGSGFAYKKNNSKLINLHKGFNTVDELLTELKKLKLKLNDELIIHHRIGTSGERNAINMHPFLVSEDSGLLQSIKGEFNIPVMAHNGVFGTYSDHNSPYNDTYHFVKDFIATPEVLNLLKRDSSKFYKMFKPVINNNKLSFLFPDRDLILLGDFTEDNGYYHSNGGYKNYVYDRGGVNNTKNESFTNRKDNTFTHKPLILAKGSEDEYPFNYNVDDDNDDYYRYSTNKISNSGIIYDKSLLEKKPHIKFKSSDIKITKDNFHHFMICPTSNIHSQLSEGVLYTLEDYDPNVQINFVQPMNSDNTLYGIDTERLFNNCNFYVKNDFKSMYIGYDNLITSTNRVISFSMEKKIRTILQKKYNKSCFKFKNYGYIYYRDLRHFYDTYVVNKVTETAIDNLDDFINSLPTNQQIVQDITS